MKRFLSLVMLVLMAVSAIAAIDLERGLSSSEEAQFDDILQPILKVYLFVKYAATLIGAMMLAFAGGLYITAGAETLKKEQAKSMATGVIFGLIIIWAAPLVVNFVFS